MGLVDNSSFRTERSQLLRAELAVNVILPLDLRSQAFNASSSTVINSDCKYDGLRLSQSRENLVLCDRYPVIKLLFPL